MLKTIPTDKVRLGMYICALNGSWVDHPLNLVGSQVFR